MSLLAGIDYDSNGIYVVLVDEETGSFELSSRLRLDAGPPEDSFDRVRRVREAMPARGSWRDQGVLAIGIEATLSRHRRSIAAHSRVQGAILACLPRELLVLPLTAQEWKAQTVGKANAGKPAVRAWALEQGAPDLRQDLLDAFAIARATRELWKTRRLVAA